VYRSALIAALLLVAACSREPQAPPVRVLGEAFAANYQVTLRKEIATRSGDVAQLTHGERVEILERRRRFYRVRTAKGQIGWIDGRQLTTRAELDKIEALAAEHKDAPRVAQGTVYDPLNVHNEPNRQSPSFAQIPAKGIVDVLAYRLAPRVPYQFPPILVERKAEPRVTKKKSKEKESDKLPPPPPPDPPEPPEDWEELSKTSLPQEKPASAGDPVRMDDWTLVRLPDGRSGWVLSSMLLMAIPDEVAQYSEGHRIMGYWPVGELIDDAGVKHNHWLWVTQSQRGADFPFDGFRVFMYSKKRQRYEQAYREKKITGFFPVEVVRPGRKKDYLSEFTIVTLGEGGQKIARTFAFLGYQVTKLEERPWVPPPPRAATQPDSSTGPEASPALPWYKRLFGAS
jgi:uncharacterized protein YgiM (DUF1202 family)